MFKALRRGYNCSEMDGCGQAVFLQVQNFQYPFRAMLRALGSGCNCSEARQTQSGPTAHSDPRIRCFKIAGNLAGHVLLFKSGLLATSWFFVRRIWKILAAYLIRITGYI